MRVKKRSILRQYWQVGVFFFSFLRHFKNEFPGFACSVKLLKSCTGLGKYCRIWERGEEGEGKELTRCLTPLLAF